MLPLCVSISKLKTVQAQKHINLHTDTQYCFITVSFILWPGSTGTQRIFLQCCPSHQLRDTSVQAQRSLLMWPLPLRSWAMTQDMRTCPASWRAPPHPSPSLWQVPALCPPPVKRWQMHFYFCSASVLRYQWEIFSWLDPYHHHHYKVKKWQWMHPMFSITTEEMLHSLLFIQNCGFSSQHNKCNP